MVARADSLAIYQPYGLGRGTVEVFTIAAPAAGANFTRTTAQGYWERIISLFFTLATDANVANRVAAVEYQDADGNVLGGAAPGMLHTASNTFRYYAGLNLSNTSSPSSGRNGFALPWLFLQPGWKFVSATQGIQVGDQYGSIRGVVERFGIGPDGTPVGETADVYTERGRGYARALESE